MEHQGHQGQHGHYSHWGHQGHHGHYSHQGHQGHQGPHDHFSHQGPQGQLLSVCIQFSQQQKTIHIVRNAQNLKK